MNREKFADLAAHLAAAAELYSQLDHDGSDADLNVEAMIRLIRNDNEPIRDMLEGFGMAHDIVRTEPTTSRTIRRLLAEAPRKAGQSPAIECAVVVRGMAQAMQGALSESPEGGLRMLLPTGPTQPGKMPEFAEHFFDYEDVAIVALLRPVTIEAPRIIQPS